MQFKAIVNGKQVGNPSPQRVGVWNVLLEHGGTGRFSWKFEYEEGRHLYQGTVTMLGWTEERIFIQPERTWVTVPYEIVRIE
jgi:hypothetical protein